MHQNATAVGLNRLPSGVQPDLARAEDVIRRRARRRRDEREQQADAATRNH
jgi:hypothetical protein